MSYITTAVFCFSVLTTLSQASGLDGIPPPNFNVSELGLPELPKAGFPFNPFTFFSSLPFLDALNRSKRQTESTTDATPEEETQGESPATQNPLLANCNSTQLTRSCLNCRQVLICSKNFGLLRSCFGFRRYCNEGQCTDQQPSNCDNV